MRLIFVRHGEPDYKNDCLTETGRAQAKSTAERLKNEDISVIYSSPMGRAVETASYTAKEKEMDIVKLDFMHEIDWGAEGGMEYDGHPWTLGHKLLTDNPEYVGSNEWKKHHYFRDNICLEYYEMIAEKFDEFLQGYGLERRDGLYYCGEKHEETIALFAHGGSGAVVFSHVLNLPFPFVLTTLPYGVCSVSIFEFSSEEGNMVIPRLELFNDMGHLDSFKQEKLRFDK